MQGRTRTHAPDANPSYEWQFKTPAAPQRSPRRRSRGTPQQPMMRGDFLTWSSERVLCLQVPPTPTTNLASSFLSFRDSAGPMDPTSAATPQTPYEHERLTQSRDVQHVGDAPVGHVHLGETLVSTLVHDLPQGLGHLSETTRTRRQLGASGPPRARL